MDGIELNLKSGSGLWAEWVDENVYDIVVFKIYFVAILIIYYGLFLNFLDLFWVYFGWD